MCRLNLFFEKILSKSLQMTKEFCIFATDYDKTKQ